MKLELKHIALYLPYELQWYHSNRKGTHPITLYNANTIISAVNNQNYKIVLRPMSDLYKERGGKIDIVKLAKIAFMGSGYENLKAGKDCCYAYSDSSRIVFRYNKHYGFTKYYNGNISPSPCQLELFEYLFANHYDIYGLLDQNLAINLNEIE